MVGDCGLLDAGFIKGPIHTWVRNSLKERLDRFFINTEWGDIFRKSDVSHLARVKSDHAPLLFHGYTTLNKTPSSFRYLKMWSRHHNFLDVVKEAWTGRTGAHGMHNLHFKLIRTKQKLQWWNRNIFGNIFDKLHVAENHVSEAEQRYDSEPSSANLTALNRTIAELVLATKIEEDYWHQKSSCKWIVEGERNTKYFHNLVKYKRIKSRIHSVLDNGVNLTEDSDIQKSCVNYFSQAMANDLTPPAFQCPFPLPRISDTDAEEILCSLPTAEEVKKVVFSINSDSIAGPDGFSSHFYQICWPIIHEDVISAVHEFFQGHPLPKCFTSTTVVLIPKKPCPMHWNLMYDDFSIEYHLVDD
ncbi:hypothetical protein DH2020_028986 [Rehmannia glutinosa]|uniref:RNA-directed DNA polymerase (Reverse transcriptase) n=1 Tax=Rehmannia glutinosa TaxID=99300 RepID=A0ABR0VPV0_REHGL